jgi:hypothetical protein
VNRADACEVSLVDFLHVAVFGSRHLSIVTNHDEEECWYRETDAFSTLQRASNLATGPGFA